MITDDYKLDEILDHIPVASLTYTEWAQVGMALKTEGYPCSVWDQWSRNDSRYKSGECEKKWESFRRNDARAGTIIQMAIDHGWKPEQRNNDLRPDIALDWDSEIGGGAAAERKQIVDLNWIEDAEIPPPPSPWHPAEQVRRYLTALFESSEYVGICTDSYEYEGKYKPKKGTYGLTQGELLEKLDKYGDDLGSIIGDYKKAAGAWVRFNPLDGKDANDSHVTAYRYALVESDSLPIPRQYAIIREMKLPVRILVNSGGKSLHAIVKIDADTEKEYRERVDFLYKVCQNSGLDIDRNNRNPSRLSRLPGVDRGENKQYIVTENIGLNSWDEWVDYIQGINDDLPNFECFGDIEEFPPLQPELIQGILRLGHKMLIAGPSKAGKSFLLIELAVAIAEGKQWLGYDCRQGRVLYINLEIAKESCLDRVRQIYEAIEVTERSRNLDIWNLRGCTVPLDVLTPRLIRRARDRRYSAIIIDPLYKVITGDENSAEDMAKFCNLFDKIATQLGCSVIYCHHHSKGAQGAKKAMDRASGSGVFARDPDAILDMIQLIVKQDQKDNILLKKKDALITEALGDTGEEQLNFVQKMAKAKQTLPAWKWDALDTQMRAIDESYKYSTGWRIESTLREFPPTGDIYAWYKFPVHEVDGSLSGMHADGEKVSPAEARKMKAENSKAAQEEKREQYMDAYQNANMGDPPTVQQLADYLGISEKTVNRNMKKFGMWLDKNDHLVKLKNGQD